MAASALAAIIMVSLLLRLSFILDDGKLHETDLRGDARNYAMMAMQLVDDGIYGYVYHGHPKGGEPGVPNARVTPGYPLLLSAAYLITGTEDGMVASVRIFQALMGGLATPLLAYLLGRRLFAGRLPPLALCGMAALYRVYIFSPYFILTETVSLTFAALYMLLMQMALDGIRAEGPGFRTAAAAVSAGAAFAACVLLRPAIAPICVIPIAIRLIQTVSHNKRARRKTPPESPRGLAPLFKASAACLCGFLALMSPWWIRNAVTLGAFIPTSNGSGNAFLAGTYPDMEGLMEDVPDDYDPDDQTSIGMDRLMAGLRDEPLKYLRWYTAGKSAHMLGSLWLPGDPGLGRTLGVAAHFAVVALGVLGLALSFLRRGPPFAWLLCGLAHHCIHLMFIPENRYAYLTMFFLMIGCAHLLERAAGWVSVRLKAGWARRAAV
ncbi:MAG: hypothetical protein FWE70_06920 [Oscillospiraceae bacterium]|nr:hypothetical protein [Oscillospiraceae bacterium]